jgi:CRISPR-associated endonuclease Cas2
MSAEMTIVIAYDISSARLRRKVATRLQEELVRVQGSVFEGRMPRNAADRLFDEVSALIETSDRLRLYVITANGLDHCRAQGGTPLTHEGGYWLV